MAFDQNDSYIEAVVFTHSGTVFNDHTVPGIQLLAVVVKGEPVWLNSCFIRIEH